MTDFTELQPMQLSVGSHKAGSGMGCAMNVISWENGDTQITDYPECSDRTLARIVQHVNDNYCSHREFATPGFSWSDTGTAALAWKYSKRICAPCSVEILDLAHKTVGTNVGMPVNLMYWNRYINHAGYPFGIDSPPGRELLMRAAHEVIDRHWETIGSQPEPVPTEVTAEALEKMLAVA